MIIFCWSKIRFTFHSYNIFTQTKQNTNKQTNRISYNFVRCVTAKRYVTLPWLLIGLITSPAPVHQGGRYTHIITAGRCILTIAFTIKFEVNNFFIGTSRAKACLATSPDRTFLVWWSNAKTTPKYSHSKPISDEINEMKQNFCKIRIFALFQK